MADRTVTVIQPRLHLPSLSQESGKQRVAAYARVSTDSDEQMGSVEAQKDYFEKLILKRPDWEFAGIYADEGISGTSLNRREAFNRMVADALDGKIDLIITKSLSRFARNTVDTLNTIRKLKITGVGVYFEKEDINTLDNKGEFLITLMSSLAEEESRSISENVKWGQRKRFADGKYSLPYKQFLGYKKGANGAPELVEEEAKIIRLIYRLFLQGYATAAIANILTNAGIPTPAKCSVWQRCTIVSILSNEKYYGAALMQKTYCIDFRSKLMVPNRGELPMYYVENGHEPIVTKAVFDEVQNRMQQEPRYKSTTLLFSRKLFCANCEGAFGRIHSHSAPYTDILWRCSNLHRHKFPCKTPYLYEEMLKPIFHEIILSVIKQNPGIVRECISALKTVSSTPTVFNKSKIMNAMADYDVSSAAEGQVWRAIIQKVIVHPGHLLEFHILDGTVMPYQMVKTAPRAGSLSQGAKQEALQAYQRGKSIAEIACDFDVSDYTVRSLCHQAFGQKPPRTTTCANCGIVFPIRGKKERKYCSQNCYGEMRFNKGNDKAK